MRAPLPFAPDLCMRYQAGAMASGLDTPMASSLTHRPHATAPPPPPRAACPIYRTGKVAVRYSRLHARSSKRYAQSVRKRASQRKQHVKVAPPRVLRYHPRGKMGRPPQPPRSYVTRHVRFQRALDAAIRHAALEERRAFTDLLQIMAEDWLKERARSRGEVFSLPPRGRRQPRKPPRKP